MGTALMSRYASKYMQQAGGGAIVNVGSISASLRSLLLSLTARPKQRWCR